MKRLVSKHEEKYYTDMLKVINSIGGRTLNYNWLITDIEAYPNYDEFIEKVNNEYLILSNDELIDMLEKDNFQWIWATFSAISNKIDKKDILQYNLPFRENVSISYYDKVFIQHPMAEIEIDCVDSSYFVIIFRNDDQVNKFESYYPKLLESIDSPEDYFTSWENRTMKPTFEFSYHKFNSAFSIKNNIFKFFKRNKKVIHYEDSLHIYDQYFNDFIRKYPYFDEITLRDGKKGQFYYFGMDNYYDKEQTKYILSRLKSDIKNDNKIIIKFLEKAITEHDGFYIHGI